MIIFANGYISLKFNFKITNNVSINKADVMVRDNKKSIITVR